MQGLGPPISRGRPPGRGNGRSGSVKGLVRRRLDGEPMWMQGIQGSLLRGPACHAGFSAVLRSGYLEHFLSLSLEDRDVFIIN